MTDTIQTWDEADLDEKEKLEREKKGLIGDLAEQRRKNRALEERIAAIEQSLTAPDPTPPTPATERVNKLAQDPDAYILSVVSPVIEEKIQPVAKGLSDVQLERKLNRVFEFIADEEGITRKEAEKRYDKKLGEIVESHGLRGMDPFDGSISAWKILKQEESESKRKEEERSERINENHSETSRNVTAKNPFTKPWKRSEVVKLIREGQYEKHREEIERANAKGLVINDM